MSKREAITVRTGGAGTKRDARAIVTHAIGIAIGLFMGGAGVLKVLDFAK